MKKTIILMSGLASAMILIAGCGSNEPPPVRNVTTTYYVPQATHTTTYTPSQPTSSVTTSY